jgi:serine O-acetyltransferase
MTDSRCSNWSQMSPPTGQGSAHACLATAVEPVDWNRELPHGFWDPSRKLLLSIRRFQYWKGRRGLLAVCACKLLVLRHRFWSAVTGADIPLNCRIGGGLLIPHPNGIVIHPDASIGVNCLIFQQVTLGTRLGTGVPVIEDHVDIGAGAKVLGGIRIGARVTIGANAVVLTDVPSGASAIGIPATIRPRVSLQHP